MKGIGDKVTQDMLILAGRDDHMITPLAQISLFIA